MDIATRQCSHCKKTKPFNEFNRDNREVAKGHRYQCRECSKKSNDEWRKNVQSTPEDRRRGNLKRLYGLTQEQYLEMYEQQKGKCGICGDTQKVLHIDHEKGTKLVRGLLCTRCNPGLGFFLHDTTRLQAAIEYLQDLSHNESLTINVTPKEEKNGE